MKNDDEFIFFVTYWMNVSMLLLRKKQQKRWLNRRWLVSPINQKRIQQGDYDNLFQEIKNDSDFFYRYTRMTLEHFEKLVELTKPYLIKKKSSCFTPRITTFNNFKISCYG
ncbi:uncharacterized protein [Mycetomoellerius zeteki]|uniref:uncharacterized protein n=1 Tax=Mycetomoellerius zeteki TaxID=64791 RepID=UPI00084EA606|nr:PREDICTED: uncharacterized protein LOC108720571 [Trachymyrmex zeteki]